MSLQGILHQNFDGWHVSYLATGVNDEGDNNESEYVYRKQLPLHVSNYTSDYINQLSVGAAVDFYIVYDTKVNRKFAMIGKR